MHFQTPLMPAVLIRRYKRFLADIRLEHDGRELCAHCPNPGAMLGLNAPGTRIWVEPNDDPKKKLNFGWRLSELDGGHFAGIDTSIPNRVVAEALRLGQINCLRSYETIRPEVRYASNSRIDFLLQHQGLRDVYLEVKNAHLSREAGWAEFPDCVTKRGTKHLYNLIEMVKAGHRAILFYLVQRTDCQGFRVASDLDPAYAQAFADARRAGVEILCFAAKITTQEITLGLPLRIASADE